MKYVDDPTMLTPLCDAWARCASLAVDTEFERSVTYFPRPALIQVCDGDETWLIDPLAVTELETLGRVFAAGRPTKIMHSALEDLTVLECATGRPPDAVFDTQLAAAFAGHGFGMGYHALVEALLGIQVSKDQTRSDWLRRPLSAAQLAYAAADVEHLHPVHSLLVTQLDELGRRTWLEEETQLVFRRARSDDVERDYLRLAGQVEGDRARGALKSLVAWREEEARRRDRPRRHVADDPLLVDLARALPLDRQAVESLPSWTTQRRRHASPSALLSAVSQAREATGLPAPPQARDLTAFRETLGELKRIVNRCASDLGVEPALLAPRRLIEKALIHVKLAGHEKLPEEFRGWRAPLLEAPFLECLSRA